MYDYTVGLGPLASNSLPGVGEEGRQIVDSCEKVHLVRQPGHSTEEQYPLGQDGCSGI